MKEIQRANDITKSVIVPPEEKRQLVNLKELWEYKDLFWFLVWRDSKNNHSAGLHYDYFYCRIWKPGADQFGGGSLRNFQLHCFGSLDLFLKFAHEIQQQFINSKEHAI